MAAVLVPMGRISGDVTVAGRTFNQSANGFGDPMIEFNINVLGPPAQKNIPDVPRYEPGFSVDLLADLAESEAGEAYRALGPAAAARIEAGVVFLQRAGFDRIAIVSHAMGKAGRAAPSRS